jgi:hypothetical protein
MIALRRHADQLRWLYLHLQRNQFRFRFAYHQSRPPLWSSGQSSWLQTQKSRVRFPALPHFLSSSGSGTGSTQPRADNWGATWKKNSGSDLEDKRLTAVGIRCADHATPSTRKIRHYFAGHSGRSVGIIPLRTKSHGVCFVLFVYSLRQRHLWPMKLAMRWQIAFSSKMINVDEERTRRGVHQTVRRPWNWAQLILPSLWYPEHNTAPTAAKICTEGIYLFFKLKSWGTQNFITIKTSWNTND